MRRLNIVLACVVFVTTAHARRVLTPIPSVQVFELAEQSRVRALSAAEVSTVMANEISAFVYLEALLNPSAPSLVQTLPAKRPAGCLVAPLFDLAMARQDGTLSDAESDALVDEHLENAYFAYLVGTGGSTNPRMLSRLASLGRDSRARNGAIAWYYGVRAIQPVSQHLSVDFNLDKFRTFDRMGIARLVELGPVAADGLVAKLSAVMVPTSGTSRDHPEFGRLLAATIYVLGASNDPRLNLGGILSAEHEAYLGGGTTSDYLSRRRAHSGRDLEMERAVQFWRYSCQ